MISATSRKSRIAVATVPSHGTKTNQLRKPTLIPLSHVTKPLHKQNSQTEDNTAKFQKLDNKDTIDADKRNNSAFQAPLHNPSNNIIQVIPTFQILNEMENDQLETLRRIAEKFVSRFDEGELEALAFSNTPMSGSHLEKVPSNIKIVKKLQLIFGIGSYKIIQSYLSTEQLVIVLVRNGSEMDPDLRIRTPQRVSSVRVRNLRTDKVGPSVDITGYKGRIPDTISESPEPIETTGRFIRHHRSNDYITLYDEIAKVGSPEDVTSITGSSQRDKQNDSSPYKIEGDSGYFSTSSEENSPVLGGFAVAVTTKKCSETSPVIDSSPNTPSSSNPSPSSPNYPSHPFANHPIPINCFTGNPTTSPLSEKSTRKYSDIPSPFRSRPLIPRESSNTSTPPAERTVTSRLPVIRKKELSELQSNACKIAPIIKSEVNVGTTNQTGTPLASDMMKCNSIHPEQTNKKAKRPLINYAKLRRKTVEANTEVATSTAGTNNSSESGDNEGNKKHQILQQEAPISLQEEKKSSSTIIRTKDIINTLPPSASIMSSTTFSDPMKVKKPLKDLNKAGLLTEKRKSQSNQYTTKTTAEEVGSLEELLPPSGAVTVSLCPSSDPARPQSSLSRCSSVSSLFTEYPPIPTDFLSKVKKPLKNFYKAYISTRAKNAGPSYQASVPNMELTPIGIPERKAFTLLPKVSPLLSKATFVKFHSLQYKTPPPTIIHHPIAQDSKSAIVDDQPLTVKPQPKTFAKYQAKTLSNGSLKKLPISEGQKVQPANTKASEVTLSVPVVLENNTSTGVKPSSDDVTPQNSHQEIDNASRVPTIMDTTTPPIKGPQTTATINNTGTPAVTTLKIKPKSSLSKTGAQNRSKNPHRIISKPDSKLHHVSTMNTKTKRAVCAVSSPTSEGSLSLESADLPVLTVRLSENRHASARPHPITSHLKNSDARPTSSGVRTKSTKAGKPTAPAVLLKGSYAETRGKNKLEITPAHVHQKSSSAASKMHIHGGLV